MYSCIKLNLFCEGWCSIAQDVKRVIVNQGVPFKELHNSSLLFSAIKNPNNIIIIVVSTQQLLAQLETFAKSCHNYQNRIFVVFKNKSINDNFFSNYYTYDNTINLSQFLSSPAFTVQTKSTQPSQLLTKLVQYELQKLQIPTKYIGFNYLTQLSVNYLCNNYSSNTYIELFECVASINIASIDTIERDVRHMILTTWKNNPNFRNILQRHSNIEKPNSKNILLSLLSYLKSKI